MVDLWLSFYFFGYLLVQGIVGINFESFECAFERRLLGVALVRNQDDKDVCFLPKEVMSSKLSALAT